MRSQSHYRLIGYMPHLMLTLLGGFRATFGDAGLIHFPTDKIRSLFAYLAVEADRPHRREILATLFWGDWPNDVALRNLRQSLHRLRTTLDQAVPAISDQILTITRQDVTLHSDVIQIDVLRLRAAIDAVAQHRHSTLAGCPSCLAQLSEAVQFYTGELMAGISIGDAPEFESWLTRQRESLGQGVLKALLDLADAHLACDEAERSYDAAQRQLALEPWREVAHRQAMRALAAAGRRTDALNQYKLCCDILAAELGVTPEDETTALYTAIRDSALPSLRGRPQTNLPAPITSFVGRRTELDEIQSLLATNRLLTLTGAGGSGKTRLALEVGRRLTDLYADGVYWVDLAEVTDEQWVSSAVASALQIAEAPDQALTAVLADGLRNRHLLLILDNCEHLLPACARLVAFLLGRAPRIQVLATSREALSILGEQITPVATLSVPNPQSASALDLNTLLTYESVRLFVDRATAHRPDFVLDADNAAHVVAICHQLDGIPLALELAAARMRTLSPAQIAQLLASRFDLLNGGSRTALPRQQTLRALIDWSYDLLTDPERVLFRRLAIFNGGCSLDAAQGICADPPKGDPAQARVRVGWPAIDGEPVIHLLSRLVEKSLVQPHKAGDELRYQMLDTIRAYADERLLTAGEVTVLQHDHAHFYTEMAVQAGATIFTADEVVYFACLQLEHENLRKVLSWTLDQPASAVDPERSALGIRLAGALGYFWDVYVHLTDADHWLHQAWDQVDVDTPPLDRAHLASGLGTLHWQHSRLREAQHWHATALDLYRGIENWFGISLSLHHLAVVSMNMGEMAEAVEHFQSCIRATEVGEQPAIMGLGWVGLGNCYLESALLDLAMPALEQGVTILRRFRLDRALAYASTSLCDIYLHLNRLDLVDHAVNEINAIAHRTGDRNLQVAAHIYRLELLRRQQQWDEAYDLWSETLRVLQEIGVNTHLVSNLESFALFMLAAGDPATSLLMLRICDGYRISSGERRQALAQQEIDAALAQIQARLSPDVWVVLHNQGEGMTLEQAIALALERVRHAGSVTRRLLHQRLTNLPF
ncbi:hypothetical protein GC175_21640 [bacterium]|nr:hypothetical protein [bacterium]